MGALQHAIDCLSGVTVTTQNGADRYPALTRAKPAAWMLEKGLAEQPSAAATAAASAARSAAEAISKRYAALGTTHSEVKRIVYPQAYLSDVPTEFGEEEVRSLHLSCGLLDTDLPISMKLLPSKTKHGETC